MKNVALTVSGNRYEIKLEDEFADFVNKDLEAAGVNLYQDGWSIKNHSSVYFNNPSVRVLNASADSL